MKARKKKLIVVQFCLKGSGISSGLRFFEVVEEVIGKVNFI